MSTWTIFTAAPLFQDVQRLGFGACGTVRTNRRGVPSEMKAKLQKGEVVTEMVDDKLMALKWQDKRPVVMLTTVHDDSVVTKQRWTRAVQGGTEEVRKPLVVERYNQFMAGVDVGDQLLSYYGFSHRSLKWWRRAFFHLIEIAIVNAYIMYLVTPHTGKRMTHKEFRVQLAKELLLDTIPEEERCRGPHSSPNPPSFRLTGRHFPAKVGQTPSGRPSQPDCVVCSRKKGNGRKSTTYKCKQCDLPMCVCPVLNFTIPKQILNAISNSTSLPSYFCLHVSLRH